MDLCDGMGLGAGMSPLWRCLSPLLELSEGHLLALSSLGFCIGYLSCQEGLIFEGRVKSFNLASRQLRATDSFPVGEWQGQMGVLNKTL